MTHPDSLARQQALDPTRSFCVTAPAGSGKTELLTQRILALLARVERPEQVLAITFTRKAAAEMRERLVEKLEQALQAKPVKAEHERITRELALAVIAHSQAKGWSLTAETFNLRTIDSLCGDLTRQMPVLSAIGGPVEVTDQYKPLFTRAVNALMEQVDETSSIGEALRALLLHFDNDWSRLRELLVRLLERRGDWGVLGLHHTPEESREATEITVRKMIVAVLQRAVSSAGDRLAELEALARFAADNLGLPGELKLTAEPERLPDWRQALHLILTREGGWRSPKGINKTLGFPTTAPDEKARLATLLESFADSDLIDVLGEIRFLPEVSVEEGDWPLVLHLSRLLPVLLAQLLLVFKQEGRVDYTHIALAAEDALGPEDAPTDLALRLDYQLEHILVDEFQDTSDQQFRLLRKLTRGWAEHNATGASPRTLFIVGDGMQSIYGFRYANVGLFLSARRDGIGGLALTSLALTRNFRSQQGIVDWVNRVFAHLLPDVDNPARGQVCHVRADATHDALGGAAVEAHLFAEDGGEEEAAFIADRIAGLKAQDPGASIAVLVRARRHVEPLIRALRTREIPFVGRDLETLQHTAVVQDLVALCHWLANPADDIASLALLRSPVCGLTLGQLQLLLAGRSRPITLRTVLRQGHPELDDQGAQRVATLLAALDWAVARRDRLSLPVWVEQVWLRLGGNRVIDDGGRRDARQFFDLLRQAETEGAGLDMEWLESRLGQLYAKHDADDGAVELMTIHKSKGLQFDYVFMPMLHKGVNGNDRELLRWYLHVDQEGESLVIAADDRSQPGTPSLYNYLSWLQKQKDAAELRRLLYVGITRARHRVWLTAQASDEKEWPSWPSKSSPMGILRAAIEPETHCHDRGTYHSPSLATALPVGQLQRLTLDTLPALTDDTAAYRSVLADVDRTTLYARSNLRERAVGTVVHRVLELLATRDTLPSGVDEKLQQAINTGLRQQGLSGSRLDSARVDVIAMVEKTLGDDMGRWILEAREGAFCELGLFVQSNDVPEKRIIDRTFIDPESGIRWVVDYKTSRPAPEDSLEAFLQCEQARYRDQLLGYSQVMVEFDDSPRPLKTALYFPALGVWHPTPESDGG